MLQATRYFRSYAVKPLPTNLSPTERFLRGSMRLWSRQVGDRRLKGTVPLAGFLEFVSRRSLERRTRALDLAASGDGDELPELLNAWRMLNKARTVDVNDVTETVHLRSYYEYNNDGFYGTMMRAAASWKPSEKVPVQKLIDEHFPNMSLDDFVVAQTLIDEFIGMKDNSVFVVNRYGEDDFTFLLRRALWSMDEEGLTLDEIEDKMRELWNLDYQKLKSATASSSSTDRNNNSNSSNNNADNDDDYLPSSGFRRHDGVSSHRYHDADDVILPSLPFRCKTILDVLNENLSDWFFTVQDRSNTNATNATAPLRVFYFGWDAVLKDVIRAMPATGFPGYVFRRSVLAHHPCLAHSKTHGSWKAMMERLLVRYDEWATISVARTDSATYIVRRLFPTQVHAKPESVTSETIRILSLMESMNHGENTNNTNKSDQWVSFDDVARCMSSEVKAQVEGAESVFQLLKISHFLEPDVRLFVRETSSRAENETIVLLDSSAVLSSNNSANSSSLENIIPKLLLQANPLDAPHARIICARKKHEPAYFSPAAAAEGKGAVVKKEKYANTDTTSIVSTKKNPNNSGGEDVVAPAWMSNSVILVAQLAKFLATANNENNLSEGNNSRRLKNVIVIIGENEDKEALRQEIQILVGENVGIEFASAKLN